MFIVRNYVQTSDTELHLFLLQEFSLPADGAGVGGVVVIRGMFQGQTEVSKFQQVSLHLCSSSVKPVLFSTLVTSILIHMDLPVVSVLPLHSSVLEDSDYSFAGQPDRLLP